MQRNYDKPLKPKSDTIFRHLFGSQGSEEVLAGILSAALSEDISTEGFKIIDPILKGQVVEHKESVLDVLAVTKGGEKLHCEIQLATHRDFKKRVTYMNARLLSDQIDKGDEYHKLARVVSVVIADFALIDDSPSRINRYKLYDPDTASRFTEIMEIVTLELAKETGSISDTLANWIGFLKAETYEELDVLALTDPVIKKAVEMLKTMSEDARLRRIEESHAIARRDINHRIRDAREDGVAEGEARGRAKGEAVGEARGRAKLISNMAIKGLDVAQIADLIGLCEADVSAILATSA